MSDISERLASLSPEELQSLANSLLAKRPVVEKEGITPRVPRPEPVPLSYSQEGTWLLDRLGLVGAAYNETIALRLEGDLDTAVLERCFEEVVRRHEILRTRIETTEEGRGIQVVEPAKRVRLETIDLSSLSVDERAAEIRRRSLAESLRPFDLARGPLFSLVLLKLSEQEHVLCWTVHHVVWDGWSLGLLLGEVSILYATFVKGYPSPLPELKVQYADHAIWQRERLEGGVLEEQFAYWKEQLTGAPPALELPTDHPRPTVASFRGGRVGFTLPRELSAELNELSRREGLTLFMVLLAAFQVLLSRWAGQEDVVVGSPTAGRPRGTEGLIGFFVNTLVMRSDVSGDPSFREFLQRVKEVSLGAFEHSEMPLDKLVAELQPDRDLSRHPLFQVLFVLQNQSQSGARLELSGVTLKPAEAEHATSKFDLTLECFEDASGELHGYLEYASDLFERPTIERWVDSFTTLLEGIVANPGSRISELALLSMAQRRQLSEWNQTAVDYKGHRILHRLFEEQSALSSDAVAVSFEDEELTYEQLNQASNRVAHYLISQGVRPDEPVGLCAERSIEMVVALMGILKAGAAYLPIDPEYPQSRIEYLLKDAGARVVLTQQALIERLAQTGASVNFCALDAQDFDTLSQENPELQLFPENLAYIIYTSGSTGQPKGVAVSHDAICNRLVWMQSEYSLQPADRILQKTPFTFDVSVWEFFWPLLNGAQLVVARPAGHKDPQYLVQMIRRHGITILHFVPSMLSLFINQMSETECPSLRDVICSGEALPPSLVSEFYSRHSARLHNLYGPTEAAVDVTYYQCSPDAEDETIPIGRPIANMQMYVLDGRLNQVPVGVVGDLYIGGDGLARGYLNRADLTANGFIANPYGESAGARLYRTGDLARYLPDGNLDFLGRTDFQVKLRGFRIELAEIEAALQKFPQVLECVVVSRDVDDRKQLHAYLVMDAAAAEPDAGELRAFLLERLPEYMVPSGFAFLEALPLTPNGKLDRNALPAPERGARLSDQYVAPSTPAEEALAEIWAKMLRRERVGIHDNFFEMGGDSIIAVQIVAGAALVGLRVTVRDMFEHQTVASLAAVSDGAQIEAEQGLVEGLVPLTPIQHWFFEGGLLEPHHFNQSLLLQTRHKLDPELVREVVKHLLMHHDALRLRFTQTVSGWWQENAGWDEYQSEVPFEHIDFSAVEFKERNAFLLHTAVTLQASLDLNSGPLMRVALFELGQTQKLLLIIHHLAVDGISWKILLDDFQTAYQQLQDGEAVQLPSKATSFKDWAERLTTYPTPEVVESEVAYWQGLPWDKYAPLPVDHSDGVNSVLSTRSVHVSLSATETRILLQEAPRVFHSQINDVLLSALLETCAEWTRRRNLLVALEGHGREELFDDMDISRTVGWFTSLFPVFLDGSDTSSDPKELIRAVHEQLQSIPNRGLSYGIVRYLGEPNALSVLPEPEIVFNYRGQLDHGTSQNSLFRLRSDDSSGTPHSLKDKRRSLLAIDGGVLEDRLEFVWYYSDEVHDKTTIEALAARFMEQLQSVVDLCGTTQEGVSQPSMFPGGKAEQKNGDDMRGAGVATNHVAEEAEQGVVEGEVPLSPIQLTMLQRFPETFHQNIVEMTLECPQRLSPELLEQAAHHLIIHHDALRLGLRATASGWEQWNTGIDQLHEHAIFEHVDLSDPSSSVEQDAAIHETRLKLRNSLDDTVPPLLRVALIDLGDARSQILLIALHHLGVDAASLDILYQDLHAAYEQLERGEPVRLPKKTASFRSWSSRLAAYAKSLAAVEEEAYWRSLPWHKSVPLPTDNPGGSDGNKGQSLQTLNAFLDPTETESLLLVQRRFGVQMNEIMLAALVEALASWTGRRAFCIELLYHGRVDEFRGDTIDLSRTVGFLAAEIPVLLDLSSASGSVESLKMVKEQLRAIPNHGIGYGALRYMSDNELLNSLPEPVVHLNHVGSSGARSLGSRFRKMSSEGSRYSNTQESQQAAILEKGLGRKQFLQFLGRPQQEYQLQRQIDLHSYTFDDGMLMSWLFDTNVYRTPTIQLLAEGFVTSMRTLISLSLENLTAGKI